MVFNYFLGIWRYVLALGLILLDQGITAYLIVWRPELINAYAGRFFNLIPAPMAISLAALFIFGIARGLGGWLGSLAVILMSAGLISNALSLLWHGQFIDYIPVGRWYGNLADWLVVMGCFLAVILIIWPTHQEKRTISL